MIKYIDGEFADLLPPFLRDQDSIQAISYAYKMAVKRLIEYSTVCRFYSDIDSMPEYVLDYMAVELDAQYYSEDMTLEVKRKVIKKAMVWKMKAGTPLAVEELIATIFGDGEVIEWDKFDDGAGVPGTFDISTSAVSTKDMIEKFTRLLSKTKNATSHLRYVSTEHELEKTFVACSASTQETIQTITNDISINNPNQAYIHEMYIAMYDFAETVENTVIGMGTEEGTADMKPMAFGCFVIPESESILTETRQNETELRTGEHAASALVSDQTMTIGG
jgi:phage tail P2-like protein